MKIISWNVNSLRRTIKADYISGIIKKHQPDIICCSERNLLTNIEIITNYPYKYINTSSIYGYSSVGIFSKIKPKRKVVDWSEELSKDGRALALEFNNYIIVNCCYPGNRQEDLNYKINVWNPMFIKIIKQLQDHKPLIVCGSMNVENNPIDAYLNLYPNKLKYKYFSYKNNPQMDYVLIDERLNDTIENSTILNDVEFTENLPIQITIE